MCLTIADLLHKCNKPSLWQSVKTKLFTQMVISRVWLTSMNIFKMPCLPIILINATRAVGYQNNSKHLILDPIRTFRIFRILNLEKSQGMKGKSDPIWTQTSNFEYLEYILIYFCTSSCIRLRSWIGIVTGFYEVRFNKLCRTWRVKYNAYGTKLKIEYKCVDL